MRGIRFINRICSRFNLKIVYSFEGISPIFGRIGRVTYYSLDSIYGIWFSKHKIVFYRRGDTGITIIPTSEKYKIFQLIHESLCEEKDLLKK